MWEQSVLVAPGVHFVPEPGQVNEPLPSPGSTVMWSAETDPDTTTPLSDAPAGTVPTSPPSTQNHVGSPTSASFFAGSGLMWIVGGCSGRWAIAAAASAAGLMPPPPGGAVPSGTHSISRVTPAQ